MLHRPASVDNNQAIFLPGKELKASEAEANRPVVKASCIFIVLQTRAINRPYLQSELTATAVSSHPIPATYSGLHCQNTSQNPCMPMSPMHKNDHPPSFLLHRPAIPAPPRTTIPSSGVVTFLLRAPARGSLPFTSRARHISITLNFLRAVSVIIVVTARIKTSRTSPLTIEMKRHMWTKH